MIGQSRAFEQFCRARGMSETAIRRAFGRPPPPLAESKLHKAPSAALEKGGPVLRADTARCGGARLERDWRVILQVAAAVCEVTPEQCHRTARALPAVSARTLAIWIAQVYRPGPSEERRAKFFGVQKVALRRAEQRAALWCRRNAEMRALRRVLLDKLGLEYDARVGAPVSAAPAEAAA